MDLSKIKPIPTQESIQKEQEDREARKYLFETDWYVMRLLETGKTIPENVSAKRTQARAMIGAGIEAP
ncbi:hypothetical protein [Pseudomonas protegens]|uniref:hypothetical protein n=1 Tax=Pseudomonas protegens TaxID=380021 RepID=UPI001B318CFE|nr:hypothetical protein [Pseudomonas protegens]MBP5101942.1 hypothetical protein [Pseudomonas protegens]MBP5107754.1 hypothetical protein [Pseudomonas protegens]MBP5127956.1 hypothetical protein [Pseudomonas protegens]MBP5133984.1 hypothetical protein [Pseudomonas protegens]MBP5144397.1 hypothetical protein [Pseudomonas protegens]